VTASFDTVSQEWLIRFVEHRIGDRRIIRLIRKWLKAGVLEDGTVAVSDKGIGQGAVISPLLANIYLHYALDLWAMRWRRRFLRASARRLPNRRQIRLHERRVNTTRSATPAARSDGSGERSRWRDPVVQLPVSFGR
jgi:retron-type reverse transcriptase